MVHHARKREAGAFFVGCGDWACRIPRRGRGLGQLDRRGQFPPWTWTWVHTPGRPPTPAKAWARGAYGYFGATPSDRVQIRSFWNVQLQTVCKSGRFAVP